ncbi:MULTISPECIES: hypothetical protein [Pseudomonas]|jgi:hypothetical protein|uniref:Uncharacterized protein n=1 Tax=Pseudomonas azadiae TaxID=2843612 RepID=A0ABS6NU62_9PSED|nr:MULTISPECIES: hypothetical protein [Pseudomonas]MBV4451346.1 hypothetical protein [Pseudomonas azadiae]NMF42357.1 hypothetical protein [Pseudomonas sp. SWRI 103]
MTIPSNDADTRRLAEAGALARAEQTDIAIEKLKDGVAVSKTNREVDFSVALANTAGKVTYPR